MRTWRQINAIRRGHINRERVQWRRLLANIRKQQRQMFETSTDNIIPEGRIRGMVEQAMEDTYERVGTDFARRESEHLTKGKKKDIDTQWRQHMREYARDRAGAKIDSITRSIAEDIERLTRLVMAEGAEQGWGPAKIADEIIKRQSQIDTWRAMRIARTEAVGASNEGSHLGARSTSLKLAKIWVASDDAHSRDGHAALNGDKVGMDDTFTVVADDGTTDQMQYPHDPDASAANVINCRCATAYEPMDSLTDELLNQ